MEQLFFRDGIKDIKSEYLRDLFIDCKDKKVEIHTEILYDEMLEELKTNKYPNRRYI